MSADMILTLYKCEDDRKKVGKQYIEIEKLTDIVLKEETSLLKPTFTFHRFDNWKNFNYASLQWGKMTTHFYFVKNPTLLPGGIISIECECDPFETWKTYIKGLRTIVTRQEFKFNPLLYDDRAPVPGSRVLYTDNIGTVGTAPGSIILTVSG